MSDIPLHYNSNEPKFDLERMQELQNLSVNYNFQIRTHIKYKVNSLFEGDCRVVYILLLRFLLLLLLLLAWIKCFGRFRFRINYETMESSVIKYIPSERSTNCGFS